MPRYIDVEPFSGMRIVKPFTVEVNATPYLPQSYTMTEYAVVKDVDDVPTADVQEVKHGNWEIVDKNEDIWCDSRCTVCKNIVRFYNGFTAAYKYCPNCGVRMKEEK